MEEAHHPLSFKLHDPRRTIYLYSMEETLSALFLLEEKMSELDDALAAIALQGETLRPKYRVMLPRNNSIVKDTLSKLWKLASITRVNT